MGARQIIVRSTYEPPSAASCDAPGWPRPYARWTQGPQYEDPDVMLPVTWVGGADALRNDFTSLPDERQEQALVERLCAVCGARVAGALLFGDAYLDHDEDEGRDPGRWTTGPGVHARCMLLTLRFCPHFSGCDPEGPGRVAWSYTGLGNGVGQTSSIGELEVSSEAVPVTYAQVRAIAQDDARTARASEA